MMRLPKKTWFMTSALLLALGSCAPNNAFDTLCQDHPEESAKTEAVRYLQRES